MNFQQGHAQACPLLFVLVSCVSCGYLAGMSEPAPRSESPIQMPVRFVKGVGPRIAELLAAKGIHTAQDLLYTIPSRYLDRRQLVTISELEPGLDYTVAGKVVACGVAYAGRGRRIFQVALSDGTGLMKVKWFRFNGKYFNSTFKAGVSVLLSGRVTRFRNELQMIHPSVEILSDDDWQGVEAPGIVPLYPVMPQLGQKYLAKIIRNALDLCRFDIDDPLTRTFRERHDLVSLSDALIRLHEPPDDADVVALMNGKDPAHRRLIFEELFFLELGLALKRQHTERERGIRITIPKGIHQQHYNDLPFRLTGAQERVLASIRGDMSQAHPMNRLLQGDVGSGKTAVSLLAARAAVHAGYQVAIMAPTEILAEQHFKSFRTLLGKDASQVALLTAGLRDKEKKWLRLSLREGRISIVVGTHAILSDNVHFKRLGFIVIDEQHRFGVLQRKAMRAKACEEGAPDILVMTATPIPRTLAMTVYGELDISVIDEMPPGRQQIDTRVIGERQRRQLYATLRRVVERGEQVFIVYPLVEESEKMDLKAATEMADHLQAEIFPDLPIGLLHGRMSSEEKEKVMRSFKNGDIGILVATTVIEVGIDVPNATCMVIEHPERFGLSQLHQLRGRIGRGEKKSLCLLVSAAKKTEASRQRLEVMEQTNDGFRIAEEDLKIRGPGEFLGTRQSGIPDLKFANLVRDVPILAEARDAAFGILEKDPDLVTHVHFKGIIRNRWSEKLALADIG